jgi:peptide deformylase
LCINLLDSRVTAIRHILTLRQSDSCGIFKFIIQVFINPKLKVVNYEKVLFPEACESVRGFSADVARYREVLVTGRWYWCILRGP